MRGHAGHRDLGGESSAAVRPGSPRKLIAIGLVAMAATIAVTTAGALLIESGGHSDAERTMTDGERAGHREHPRAGTARASGDSRSRATRHESPTRDAGGRMRRREVVTSP